jgi:hypothetical protein
MRIHIPPLIMAQLRGMGLEGGPLWDAIERLRIDQAPPDSIEAEDKPGRRELLVRIGLHGFWIGWEVEIDRGETVIRVMVVEENL